MRARYLSKRDAAALAERIRAIPWGRVLRERKPRVALEIIEGDIKLYKIGGFLFADREGILFPVLDEQRNKMVLDILPSIIVDMGAVPHIANGADVMRPGVREVKGSFNVGELLVVRDERHLKPLAIVRALVDYETFSGMDKGKVAENLHHVDDKIWKILRRAQHLLERGL